MTLIEFTKMQGLGNDFVVVDGAVDVTPEIVRALCDRRFGVGADGVLRVTAVSDVEMDYWNADGTTAEMCGNGLRCVARYAFDKGMTDGGMFEVQTPVGLRRVIVDDEVRVDLGSVSVIGHRKIDGQLYHVIDVGNPHAVAVVDDPAIEHVGEIGPRLQSEFEGGVNVEFARIRESAIDLRVWERGVGETLACGSGMVAAAFVATKTDKLTGPITVTAPGGEAVVRFEDGASWLAGPADYVFTGTFATR